MRARRICEAKIWSKERVLLDLINSTAEGLYCVDTEGRCTFINQSALRLLGYEHESELLGKIIHNEIHHSHPDGSVYQAQNCRMYQAYRKLEAIHVADEVFWKRDGSSFQVEYWSRPLRQGSKEYGAVATFFDISERIRTELALQDSEKQLSKLVDTVADGIIATDGSGQIVLFNQSAEYIFGISSTIAIGASISNFISEPLPTKSCKSVQSPAEGISDSQHAFVNLHTLIGRRASGSNFPLEASVSTLKSDDGLLKTIVLRDISDRRAALEERKAREILEASNTAKNDFVSRMSHELRTPLNAVIGFAQLLRIDQNPPLSQNQASRVKYIEQAGAHLLALVNDILDFSRVESGKLCLTLETIELCSIVEESVLLVETLAAEAGVRVKVIPSEIAGGFWIIADRVRLRQVLVNLISNAVKYNRRDGQVILECAKSHEDLVDCIVTDNGIGMTEKQLSCLFQPFNRLGAERTSVEGTGIGLVLSKHLVELMHGTLAVTSNPALGTRAVLSLRRSNCPASRNQDLTRADELAGHEYSLDVLYAEDNAVNIEIIRELVSFRPSVRLRIATNGADALIMARATPPDLMLIDMNLGDITGLQLARELRRERHTASVPLVALSADARPSQIETALAEGFARYLTKPVVFSEVLQVFDDAVRRVQDSCVCKVG